MEKEKNKFQPVGKVKVVKGSVLYPENSGLRFVLSINNLAGKTDQNPLYPIFDKKWKKVKEEARGWYATKTGAYKLGAVNTTATQSDVWVLHMLCQDEQLETDQDGLKKCLEAVCKMAKYEKATVHVSKLLVDAIDTLSDLCKEHLVENGVNVYYYEESQ